jgi:hypothetical protein
MDRGTVRLVIVVALAVVGGFVLANGFDGSAATVGASPTPTVSPTDTPTDSPTDTPTDTPTDKVQPQPPEEVFFTALNSTNVTGAGAAAQDKMEEAGYQAAEEAFDSPVQGAAATTILYRGGEDADQNKANAKQIKKSVFPGGDVEVGELSQDFADVVSDDATIVVVIGEDWADRLVQT